MEDINKVWEDIKNKIKNDNIITDVAHRTFIEPLKIQSVVDNDLNIVIPFEQDEGIGIDYYNKKYKTMLEVATEEITGKQYNIYFINNGSLPEEKNEPVSSYYNISNLSGKYTFDTFVVGKNNRLRKFI